MSSFTIIFIIIGLVCFNGVYGQLSTNTPKTHTSSGSITPERELKQAMENFEIQCDKNGGSYKKFLDGSETYKNCLYKLADQLYNETGESEIENQLVDMVQKYCMNNVTYLNCIDKFTSVIVPCFEIQQRPNIGVHKTVRNTLHNFLCNENSQKVRDIVAADGMECLQQKCDKIINCFITQFGDNILSVYPIEIREYVMFLLAKFDEKQCNNLRELQHCTVEQLKSCDNPELSSIFSSLFSDLIDDTPCREIKI